MKKARTKKATQRSENTHVVVQPTLTSTPREDQDPLRPGDVVMLPDGGMAAIEKIVGTDAYVIEWAKQLGRGPWIFPISELVPV